MLSREDNDLLTLTGGYRGTPVLQFIRPYAPDLIGWFRDFGQSTANYDANGHFARISPLIGAFQLTDTPGGGQVLNALPPSKRSNASRRAHGPPAKPSPCLMR